MSQRLVHRPVRHPRWSRHGPPRLRQLDLGRVLSDCGGRLAEHRPEVQSFGRKVPGGLSVAYQEDCRGRFRRLSCGRSESGDPFFLPRPRSP